MLASKDNFYAPESSDLPSLATVARAAYADHYLHYWDPDDCGRYYMDLSFSEHTFRRDHDDPNALLYAIALDRELVGYMKLNRVAETEHCPELVGMELEKIYLRGHAVGRGLGKAAMRLAEQRAVEAGQPSLWLKVMAENRDTVAFYESLGFAIRSHFRIDIAHMKDHMRGMLVMSKSICIG